MILLLLVFQQKYSIYLYIKVYKYTRYIIKEQLNAIHI